MARRRPQQPTFETEQGQDLRSARQDAVSAVIVWVLLEGLSFLILPTFEIIKGENKLPIWLSISVPPGLVGAVLIGVSSWWVKRVQEKVDRRASNKQLLATLAQAVGWLGLIGIGLPIMMVGLELWFSMMRGGK